MKVISYHIRSLIICLLLIDEPLFKNVVTPFVVGVMRKEIVTVRLAIVKQHNMIEGTGPCRFSYDCNFYTNFAK